ncbi:DUF4276 family protein [Mucilaginibacter psychrotolerans]|uniref:DUF4276 family protein n=1 Tax=Mucilaginibacter psychrotolerans TaxID=1524096 RepID=A0A4Y8SGW1_9SPHI|nr:DUF4276 family protein [Mucilaginibacter psychrotolerans]TFF38269.1 DUF4276 family protein [Mucilaginibacter psychrotolerans]
MKRIIIICEGPTEMEFCKDVLSPFFNSKDIFLQTPLIKKSGGGIVPWSNLKRQIETHLSQDTNAIVSTFIDYYGILPRFLFPEWQNAHKLADKYRRMDLLEKGMSDDISGVIKNRFIPYIQLHEFEGLLFNNLQSFDNQIGSKDFLNRRELEATILQFPNPELINDSPNNAPSYRLRRLIKGYNKIVFGSILAEDIGLKRMRKKSVRFNAWLKVLENQWP